MKRIILFTALLCIVSGLTFAQTSPFNMLDMTPVEGKWVDNRAEATWEFSNRSVRILFMDGSEAFNFNNATIRNVWVDPEAKQGVVVKFEWVEGGWKYTISKRFSDNFIDLKIVKPSGYVYEVALKPEQQ